MSPNDGSFHGVRRLFLVVLAGIFWLSDAAVVRAYQLDDPFGPANRKPATSVVPKIKRKPPTAERIDFVYQLDDPFGPANRKPATSVVPKIKRKPPTAERIDFNVTIEPKQARRGELVHLTIRGEPKPGFHTYPLTVKSSDPAQDETQLSKLTFAASPDFKPLWPVEESESEFEAVEGVGVFLVHAKPFSWSQDILVLPTATPGENMLRFQIHLQVCDRTCVVGDHEFELPIKIDLAAPIVLSANLQARSNEPEPALKVRQAVAPIGQKNESAQDKADSIPQSEQNRAAPVPSSPGLLALLLASMGAAFAMLLTPCVFPMIPITVSFFLKQSEKEHHNALATAAVYSLTIIVVLAAAVLVLGGLIVQLANDAWLNLGLGLLLVFFALSLFGMYEIELPSGLAKFTAAHEGKGGYAGAMFMALTFTITSFTCTGPFLGPLLVAVKEYQLTFGDRVLGALAYAATFAAPFFILALFPTLLKRLPKSGGWLNAVKVVMGFLELAAALKFLANTDLAWNPGDPALFNYETVLCAWIALAVACGMYLVGVFRLPHDSPLEHLGVGRMLLASIFWGLALYMAPALWRITPQGVVGQGLVAFLPLDTRPASLALGGGSVELTWLRDYENAWKLATSEGKLIFIDFTGQNCTNCRYNEKNLFPVPAVRQELTKYVRVQLYTDSVPDPNLSAGESKEQGRRNSGWQSATFGDVTNPFYAVIRPAKDRPFEESQEGTQKLKGDVLGIRKGLIPATERVDFEEFLRGPQKAQAQLPGSNDANQRANASGGS